MKRMLYPVIGAAAVMCGAALTAPALGSASPSAAIQSDLQSVSALSSTDVWAVGSKTTLTRRTPNIQHWDGTAWTRIRAPHAGYLSQLSAVSMASATEGFAGGNYRQTTQDPLLPFMLHWDGSAWRRVPCPIPEGAQYVEVYDVADVAPGDAWLVGSTDSGALIEHWDGNAWTVVDNPGTRDLTSVSALTTDDVWADGPAGLMHWDGSSWSVDTEDSYGYLASISVHAADDVWAAGSISGAYVTEHWDGTAWTRVSVPEGKGTRPGFADIDILTGDDVWAVGGKQINKQYVSVTYHWNGTRWKGAMTPQGSGENYLWSVETNAPDDAWAVGSHEGPRGDQSLALHWDGSTWTRTRLG